VETWPGDLREKKRVMVRRHSGNDRGATIKGPVKKNPRFTRSSCPQRRKHIASGRRSPDSGGDTFALFAIYIKEGRKEKRKEERKNGGYGRNFHGRVPGDRKKDISVAKNKGGRGVREKDWVRQQLEMGGKTKIPYSKPHKSKSRTRHRKGKRIGRIPPVRNL